MLEMLMVMPDTIANLASGGLNNLQKEIVENWLGPIFFIVIAALGVMAIKDRAWMKLATLIGIAAIAGLLIFNAEAFFGKDKGFTKAATTVGEKVGN